MVQMCVSALHHIYYLWDLFSNILWGFLKRQMKKEDFNILRCDTRSTGENIEETQTFSAR